MYTNNHFWLNLRKWNQVKCSTKKTHLNTKHEVGIINQRNVYDYLFYWKTNLEWTENCWSETLELDTWGTIYNCLIVDTNADWYQL